LGLKFNLEAGYQSYVEFCIQTSVGYKLNKISRCGKRIQFSRFLMFCDFEGKLFGLKLILVVTNRRDYCLCFLLPSRRRGRSIPGHLLTYFQVLRSAPDRRTVLSHLNFWSNEGPWRKTYQLKHIKYDMTELVGSPVWVLVRGEEPAADRPVVVVRVPPALF
jgi:hypothetical protein